MEQSQSMARKGILCSPMVPDASIRTVAQDDPNEGTSLLGSVGEGFAHSEEYLMSTASRGDAARTFYVDFRQPRSPIVYPAPHHDHLRLPVDLEHNPARQLHNPATGGVVSSRRRRSFGDGWRTGDEDESDGCRRHRRSKRSRRTACQDASDLTTTPSRRLENFASPVGGGEPNFNEPAANSVNRDRFRRKLKYYFMNPIDKWRAKGRLPWKLGLQVIKIIIVTLQLLTFGMNMSKYLTHQGNMIVTFRELFMADWDTVREVMTYPPAAGTYGVYKKSDFYSHMNQAIQAYSMLTTDSIGNFGYGSANVSKENPMSPILFCKSFYAVGAIDPTHFFFNYTNAKKKECIEIKKPLLLPGDPNWKDFSIAEYLNENNFTLQFDRLLLISLKFPIRTVYLNSLDPSDEPDCYDVDVVITYDNTQHDGQTLINLESYNHKRQCTGNINHGDDFRRTYELATLNILVIALCTISLLLCLRSLYRGNLLRKKSVNFFDEHYGQKLTFSDQTCFIDMWIVMMACNDILIVSGSIFKLIMERHLTTDTLHFSATSLLLGVGNLLVWMGLMRYLGFFRQYNILVLTLRRALPHVLRFMLCTLTLYGGFCFCGWLVLGPYHMKFKTLSTTSECLFSLLNGDDMFATFAVLDPKGQSIIWWFSRIYLYSFISLFTYVVLSLFISIIMDSYETIKDYYQHGFPLSDLQRFIAECPDDASSSIFLDDQEPDELSLALRKIWSRVTSGRRAAYERIQ